MLIPSDYKELLKTLNRYKVRYLLVGAYAVIYYTEPRYTKDCDIWVEPETKNAKKVYKALQKFGAPLKGIREKDFLNKKIFYQIGVAPIRIDIMMDISGIDFNRAWRRRQVADFEGIKVNILGIKELIESKTKTRRAADRIDLESLQNRLKHHT